MPTSEAEVVGPKWYVRGGQVLGVLAILVILVLWISGVH
jgi:hypothetical protein